MQTVRTHALQATLLILASTAVAAEGVEPSDPIPAESNRLELTGVITCVNDDDIDPEWSWLSVRHESETSVVAVRKDLGLTTNATDLVDAEVHFTGFLGTPHAFLRTIPSYLCVNAEKPVILRPPPATFDEIPKWNQWRSNTYPHRQRAKNLVIAVTRNAFHFKHGMKVVPRAGETMPQAGDTVEAAGFVAPSDPGFIMTEAIVRRLGPAKPLTEDAPVETDVEAIFHDQWGRERIYATLRRPSVRFQGVVAGCAQGPQTGLTFELACGRRTLFVDASAFSDGIDGVESGCRIEVSGTALPEFERTAGSVFPAFRRICIIPRTPGDIRVLARPPWWTPRRLCIVIVVLLIGLALLAALSRYLWNRANQRAREAYHDRLARSHAESRTAERTRLATDLHDSLAQNLTGVTLQIDAARRAQARRPEALESHLETAERMLRSCRTELRRCLWDLRYEALDNPDFADAIVQTVEPVRGDVSLDVDVRIRRCILDDSSAHAALSILRELVANAVRHGRAHTVRIVGTTEPQLIRLIVTDDGTGFDPDSAPGMPQGHFGLVGIRDRLRALGGSLDIVSVPHAGCTVSFTLVHNSKEPHDPA